MPARGPFKPMKPAAAKKFCNTLHLQPTAPNQCVICQQERARRCIVGKDPKAEHFLNHPFVHGLNAAKYIAANLRAKWVASTRKHKLLWIIAQDTPLFHVEPTELQARRENWLQRHDQSTGGVVGILPLLHNMPIRVTQTLSDLKAFGLFKNTRGILWNWTLHDVDKEAVETAEGRDIVLQRLPLALYVRVAGANWQQHPDLPVGVARIEPVTQTWTLETNGKATVSRRGFPIASDYAGTAHSFMGATLGACTLDLGTWDATTSREAQLSGYMCLSRVRKSEDLCIVQPFSPNWFSHGELIGPHTFLEVHREKLTLAQAKIRFEKDKPNKQRNRDILLFCRGCSPQPHLQEKLLPLREFVSAWDQEEWFRVLSEGMSRLCTQCKTKQSNPPAKGKAKEVGSCAYCQTRPADQTGYCSECATIRLACSKCDIGKKIKTKRLVTRRFQPRRDQAKKKNEGTPKSTLQEVCRRPSDSNCKTRFVQQLQQSHQRVAPCELQGRLSNRNLPCVRHKASAGTQDLRTVCATLACKCNSRDLVHCLCLSSLQWRLWAATPPKSTQPCQTESLLVLSKMHGKVVSQVRGSAWCKSTRRCIVFSVYISTL